MIVTRGLGIPRPGSLVAAGLTLFGIAPAPITVAGIVCLSISAATVVLTLSPDC